MRRDNRKITVDDLKGFYLSQSKEIDSGENLASEIIKEEGYNVDELKKEGLDLIEGLRATEDRKLRQAWNSILQKLGAVGLNRNFVENRILPNSILEGLNSTGHFKEYFDSAIDYVSQVFDLEKNELIEFEDLSFIGATSNRAMFKKPSNSNLSQIRAYSHYVHFISKATLKAYPHKVVDEYPSNLDEFRRLILQKNGRMDLESILSAVWNMGICVLPLTDSGIFHGAAWNINGRHIIVLKQKTNSHAKWLFDLLHEMYHVFVHLEEDGSSVIESEELSVISSNESEEEREANSFANKLLLGENVEELAKKCVKRAGNRTEKLKQAVIDIAKEENIRVDALANYLAYRLDSQGTNWWGTAFSLQVEDPSPIEFTKNYLIQKLDFNQLNDIESNMLSMAIN